MAEERCIKKRFYRFYVANEVILGNAMALLLGDWMANVLFMNRAGDAFLETQLIRHLDMFYSMVCIIVMTVLIAGYERPIRQCLKAFHSGREVVPAELETARRRLLNQPYFIVALDTVIWCLGCLLFWLAGSPAGITPGIGSGLITVTTAFFWVEHAAQHTRIPLFFPKGGLSGVRGVKSISLKIRFLSLIFAVSIVPLAFIHMTVYQYRQMQMMDEMPLLTLVHRLEATIAMETAIFIGAAVILSWLVLHHLKRPVAEIIRVMAHVQNGDFTQKARVYTNDEIGFAGEMLNAMNQGLREREQIKDTFGRYVDRQIRDEILSGRVTLDGERKEATILFADLRNFTPLVAVTPAQDLIYMLNAYLDEMARAVENNGGLILQFIGDEVEAVFGAPVAREDHELAAVRCSLEMRDRLEQLNQRFRARGLVPLDHGVGIHTGEVLAAIIGTSDRSAYSLIGDTVNVASRIQGLNREFKTDILVSEQIRERLARSFSFLPMPEIRVKGKADPIQVFTLDAQEPGLGP